MAEHRGSTRRSRSRGGNSSANKCSSSADECNDIAAADCSIDMPEAGGTSHDPYSCSSGASVCDSSRSVGTVQSGAYIQMCSPPTVAVDSSSSSASTTDGSYSSGSGDRTGGSVAHANSSPKTLVCTRSGAATGRDDNECDNSSQPGTPWGDAGIASAVWNLWAERYLLLGAVGVLLVGTLNQVVGKIRAKALGRFDSVVAISNAFFYTIVYCVLMVLLWTKKIPRENISFIWSTANINNASARSPAAPAAASFPPASPVTDTEEQRRHQGLRAPLLCPQPPPACRRQQPAEPDRMVGTSLAATAAAGGGRTRKGAWRWLVITGCCDACGNILGFLAQPYVPGPYFAMALQAVVPFSCLCSMVLLRRRYTLYHLLALLLVIVGVMLPIVHRSRHAAMPPFPVSTAGRLAADLQLDPPFARQGTVEILSTTGGHDEQRNVARLRGDSIVNGKAAAVAAGSALGRPGGDTVQRALAEQTSDRDATADRSGVVFQEVAEAAATYGSALRSLEGTALKKEMEDAASNNKEATVNERDVSKAAVDGDSADESVRLDSFPLTAGNPTTTVTVASSACTGCAAHHGKTDDFVHGPTGTTVPLAEPVAVPSDRSGSPGASGAPAVVCAVGCLHRGQTEGTWQKTTTGRSNVQDTGRLQDKEGDQTVPGKNSAGIFTSSDVACKSKRASTKKGGDGIQVNTNEGIHAPVDRKEAAQEDKVEVNHLRQSGSDGRVVDGRAAAGARREAVAGTDCTTGEKRSGSALGSSVAEKILCGQKSGIKKKSIHEARREDGASTDILSAAKFADMVFAAEWTNSPADTPADPTQPPQKNTERPTETGAHGIALWLYMCLAALSTLPTALSFAIKEKLMRQYEELHAAGLSSNAADGEGDTAAARLLQQDFVDVRAVGVATLVPSGDSRATDIETALEEQSRWSSSGCEDSLLQTRSLSNLLGKTQDLQRCFTEDPQISSPPRALAAVAEANEVERPISACQRDRWTEREGGVPTTSNNNRGGRGRRSGCRQHAVDCTNTEETSSAAAKREGTLTDLDGAYNGGGSGINTKAVIEQMAAECLEEKEGAEATVLMGSGAVPPTPEVGEQFSSGSRASGFADHASASSVPARLGELTRNRKRAGRLHVIVVCAHCSAFQLLWALFALPLSSWLGQTNNESIPKFAVDAVRCFAGSATVESTKGSSCLLFTHTNSVTDVDLCPYALRAYVVYGVVNIAFNLSLIGFVAAASSLLSFVTLKATLPLGILFYALIPWPLLDNPDVAVDTSVFVRQIHPSDSL